MALRGYHSVFYFTSSLMQSKLSNCPAQIWAFGAFFTLFLQAFEKVGPHKGTIDLKRGFVS